MWSRDGVQGIRGAVEFDESADVLHGRMVNSGSYPIATFEARDAKGLRREFERSTDEYLAWCAEDGVQPRKPFSGKLNVRLGSELHGVVAESAAADGMSINSWIVQALRAATGLVPRPARLAAQPAYEHEVGASTRSTSE